MELYLFLETFRGTICLVLGAAIGFLLGARLRMTCDICGAKFDSGREIFMCRRCQDDTDSKS